MVEAWKKHYPFPEPLEIQLDNGKKVFAIPFNLLISSNEFDNRELETQLKEFGLTSCDGIVGSIWEMQNWLPTAAFACQLTEKLSRIFFFFGASIFDC
jgi:hypothetical protein